VLGFQRLHWGEQFPFSVPAIATIERLELGQSVTLLAGDNGSGKSTILEAIAAAIGFAQQGGELERLGELQAVPGNVVDDMDTPLLAPVLSATKPRNGYFLRAESFFNVAEFIDSGDRFAPDLSLYGDVPLHAQSHGESFLALPRTGSGQTVSTCSTSPKQPCRSPGHSRCSRWWHAPLGRARSSSSPLTRRSCWPHRTPASTSSTTTASTSPITTIYKPSG
jgi:energy-coupling factor transporter ATP-binding protein EcfA2